MQTPDNNGYEKRKNIELLSKPSVGLNTALGQRRRERSSPVVMIIEDDQICCTLVGSVLRKNCDWVYARDGRHALAEYAAIAPDAVLLDIGLPDMSGHLVLECILQMDPDAYVIMFSSHKDKKNVVHAASRGAQGFIGKPFTCEKLFQYLNHSPHLLHKQKQGSHK